MTINFIKMNYKYKQGVINIFNYYIETTTSAYRDQTVDADFFTNFCESSDIYCSFAIENDEGDLVGFCLLEKYIPINTFSKAAEIMYFIHPEHTGKGIGTLALGRLEIEAKKRNITRLIADISLENIKSINFHKTNGFTEFGKLEHIGEKLGRTFGIVWMEKRI